jgi:orotate phosphoribosyltransferase
MKDELAGLIPARRGHFQFESGHHGELWLDLEWLCLHPEPVQRLAERLAARLHPYEVEAVCGPLVEGAFIALMLASKLRVPFTYSERFENFGTDALYPVEYRIPSRLREELQGKRVAIVNDVINAGSAVLGTLADLEACGSEVVVIGALVVLGSTAPRFAADKRVALEALLSQPNEIWEPSECPLCARQIPLSGELSSDAAEPAA